MGNEATTVEIKSTDNAWSLGSLKDKRLGELQVKLDKAEKLIEVNNIVLKSANNDVARLVKYNKELELERDKYKELMYDQVEIASKARLRNKDFEAHILRLETALEKIADKSVYSDIQEIATDAVDQKGKK